MLFMSSILTTYAYAVNTQIFTDVAPNTYYYDAVNSMYNQGAIAGCGDGTFNPKRNITIAETLTILYRMLGITISMNETNGYWYDNVVNEAKSMGIIGKNTDPTVFATREDIANYIVKLYRIDISKTSVSNVFLDDNSLLANTMYEKGIFTGMPTDNGLIFNGNSYITRADLCVVLYRLNEKIENPYLKNLKVGNYIVKSNPTDFSDMILILRALAESDKLEIEIPYYRGLNDIDFNVELREKYKRAFEYCFSTYPDDFSFTTKMSVKVESNIYGEGKVILKISNNSYSSDAILSMKKQFNEKAKETIYKLYEQNKLQVNMSDEEKARVLFEYVATNVKYDLGFNDVGYTGFGAAIDGEAVCQGYTSYFNRLCELEGIIVEGITGTVISRNESHMWSRIKLDDTWWYCDVTFADPIPDKVGYCDFNYFKMSYEEIMQDRIEDKF